MRTGPLIVCLLVAVGALIGAPERASGQAQESMETYFAGEKRGGATLAVMGTAGLAIGTVLVTRDSDLARGAGYATLGIGGVHLAAGAFVYLVSHRRIGESTRQIAKDEGAFVTRERERMDGVALQFRILKLVEIGLIAGGSAMAVYAHQTDHNLLAGFGIGIAVESVATLVFDIVAARRAGRYIKALDALTIGLIETHDDTRTGALVVRGHF